ncbi:NAD kinase [Desertihabitans brevis]|uniref:NAD kinase n=1 Tax=Desertihabitans brevis TaxID=2268447 RepID=A0A367YZV5_9ACTN|nr:NAD kinase [Desertihabitans brevis]RCK71453.1 NAD kinase [Desertihabitans brevis]
MSDPQPGTTRPTARRVAVLTHTGRRLAVEAAVRFVTGLSRHGITALVPREDADLLQERCTHGLIEPFEPRDVAVHDGCELAVVFGGDGTILRGAEWAVPAEVPLLGVNLGHVGFLAEAESSEIDTVVEHVVSGDWRLEERVVIEVSVTAPGADGPSWTTFAVNEVSLEKASREKMLETMVEIDRRPLSRWSCDGVLVATPTGSTAYAFSAGGPVMWPGVEALLLVPLSAHALFARPLVLGPSSTIRIEILGESKAAGVVWCDGRRSSEVLSGTVVEIQRSEHRLRLARLTRAPFTDRLVSKFGLRVEGWRGGREVLS